MKLVTRHVSEVKEGDMIVLGATVVATIANVDGYLVAYVDAHTVDTTGVMAYGEFGAHVIVVDDLDDDGGG